MFKFGFSEDTTEKDGINSVDDDSKWLKSEEIKMRNNVVPPELLEDNFEEICSIELDDRCTIKHVSEDIVAKMIMKKRDRANSIFKAEIKKSDLITSIYEGGLKIWQCTYDLLTYIYENEINFENKKVLDLGCGAGIAGIYTFMNGAQAYFQDYNPEVLQYITLPNVLLNAKIRDDVNKCRFYSGDWKSFLEITESDFKSDETKFDYILTSETIYNCDNFTKLHDVFRNRLKKDGIVFLAAKTYYFGVGGGTRQFEDVIKYENCFKFETCWINEQGVKREILKLTFI